MAGYVRMYRKVTEHPVFAHPGLFRLWSYCLMRANWRSTTTMIPGTLTATEVKRGQFITGREKLFETLYGHDFAGESKPAPRSLWRWMDALESLGCINMQTLSSRCTLVTVCNYETYQGDDDDECPADDQPASSPCPADRRSDMRSDVQPIGAPVSTNKEEKERKKGRNKKPPAVSLEECLKSCEQVHLEISPVWHQWMTYKHERGDTFTATGLKSAVTHLGNKIAAVGVSAVAEAILKAMAMNWAGWDYEAKGSHKPQPSPPPPPNQPIIERFKPVDLRNMAAP